MLDSVRCTRDAVTSGVQTTDQHPLRLLLTDSRSHREQGLRLTLASLHWDQPTSCVSLSAAFRRTEGQCLNKPLGCQGVCVKRTCAHPMHMLRGVVHQDSSEQRMV